ncbi:MAG: SDR family NAD(P)-dependent oxidoreductase [Ruminococcaceae bacterium]|nr:SDR family NAD(P)-dependent oxidoreductase [Oscillospiraceae bacterium]
MNIAIITGASSGIGREFALQIDKNNSLDEIWLVARRRERLEALSKELRAKVRIVSLDLLKPESFTDLEGLLKAESPQISYLVNASGFGAMGDWREISNEVQMQMIDLNVKALVSITNICIPYMKKGSSIIEMGSASVFNPLPYFNVYASTKSFVRHYTRALHEELKPDGINVTVVCPGWVRTEFFDHTNDDNVRYSPKKYSPMVEATDVVRRALRDVKKNKALSIYGAFTKMQHILAKILPHSLIMRIWKGMLKENE